MESATAARRAQTDRNVRKAKRRIAAGAWYTTPLVSTQPGLRVAAAAMVASMLIASAVYAADVRPEAIEAHIRFLADDLLEGRETGTHGFDVAANYVASQFAQMGLAPAGDSGSWFQPIPFRGAQLMPEKSSFILRQAGKATKLVHRKDALWWADFS